MTKQVPEPHAELLSPSDVHEDVRALTTALNQRRDERKAYEILSRPDIRAMINQAIASGVCDNDESAIERALKTLITAVGQPQ
ncbi:hypothetical protein [[Phormidium] sp. ETS-05]|uniref:hypothetical protein n=1 Tax=[Phormidium] sp. ETS-05 TaxID=222819 RepID=UPI0018EECBB6|nr:hypothetical protein [[Phormidium] sp. ETS-05]